MTKHTQPIENEEILYQKSVELLPTNPNKAIEQLKSLAKKNHFNAMIKLGEYYENNHHLTQASNYYYQAYELDKQKALKPFFNVYSYKQLSSSKLYQLLKYATDVGLFKARYHLALFLLNDKHFKDYDRGEKMLLDYVKHTDDLDAIISLYQLYSKSHDTFHAFPKKDSEKAAFYYQKAIEKDSALFGSEIFDTEEVYCDQSLMPLDEVMEMILFRFKTSLSIDMAFENNVTITKLNPLLTLTFKPLTDYKAEVFIENKTHETLTQKKLTTEKETIDKHLQTTNQVTDLKSFMTQYKINKIPIEFDKQSPIENIEALVKRSIKSKLDTNEQISHIDYESKTIYLLEPILTLDFTYHNKRYQSKVNLTNLTTLDHINYPLDRTVHKKMSRYLTEHRHLKRDTYILTLINTLLFMDSLSKIHSVLVLLPISYFVLSLVFFNYEIISEKIYIKYYDTLKLNVYKKRLAKHYLYASIALFSFLLALILTH